MTFEEILDAVLAMLQRRGRVTYRTLKRQFNLDDDAFEDLKDELLYAHPQVVDEEGQGLAWTGSAGRLPAPAEEPVPAPHAYTPQHLAEKILTSRSALEGERKQVTVLFADLKGSMELLADRDPEEARQLLDPVLERMMDAVHRYEGTVNQVMGDSIMALFGAPIAHEDHAVRACYAALAMQAAVQHYAAEVQRTRGVPIQIRVGLNAGEVVVRSIGSDLRMDYTAVGQTTHLAARMEQMAMPGSILITSEVLRLAEGHIWVKSLGPVPIKGLTAPVEVFEVTGAGQARTRLQAAATRRLTRFVGRDTELETLRQAMDRAGRGHGQVVGVIGEPGVGKSRLFWEFTQSHRTQGWLILESCSVSYGKATAYLPVIDLLKTYFGIEARDDMRRVCEQVTGKLLTLDRALEPTLPAILALLDVPVEDAAWHALDPLQRRRHMMGEHGRAIATGQRVLALAAAGGDVALQVGAHYYLILAYWGEGAYLQAMDCCRWTVAALGGERRYERFGQQVLPSVLSRCYLASSLAEVGRFAEALGVGTEGLRIAETVAHPTSLVYAYIGVGAPYLGQGAYDKALPPLERAVGICQDTGLRFHFPAAAFRLGTAYTLSGRVTEALALLEQAIQQDAAMGRVGSQARRVAALGEATLLAGHLEKAGDLASHALELSFARKERGDQVYILRLLGEIAAQRNPPERERAEAHYRQALALAEELGMRPLQAHCQLGLGTLYAKTGRQEQARTELSAAIDLYRAMDMTFWLPQAEAALVQVEER